MAGDTDRTALILGLLATVIGWQSARITEEIRSTTSVAYSTEVDEYRPHTRTLIIENVSKNKSIKNVDFMLSCPADESEASETAPKTPCIKRGTVKVRLFPPTLAQTQPSVNPPEHTNEELAQQIKAQSQNGGYDHTLSSSEIDAEVQKMVDLEKGQNVDSFSINATIAAGGKLGVDYELVKNTKPPEFFFVPNVKDLVDIYVFNGDSFRGTIVRYYSEIIYIFMIITISMILLGAIGFAWMRLGGWAGIRNRLFARKTAP
jgi:hypothetical protein